MLSAEFFPQYFICRWLNPWWRRLPCWVSPLCLSPASGRHEWWVACMSAGWLCTASSVWAGVLVVLQQELSDWKSNRGLSVRQENCLPLNPGKECPHFKSFVVRRMKDLIPALTVISPGDDMTWRWESEPRLSHAGLRWFLEGKIHEAWGWRSVFSQVVGCTVLTRDHHAKPSDKHLAFWVDANP